MLRKIARSLLFTNRFLYSAPEKKNTIVVPKRYQVPFNQYNPLES